MLSISFVILSGLLTIEGENAKVIAKSGVLVALLLLAITRNNIEDELTLRIRLKAFTASFIYGVAIVILEPFINLLFGADLLSDKGVTELLISMFFFYFIVMFIMKRRR